MEEWVVAVKSESPAPRLKEVTRDSREGALAARRREPVASHRSSDRRCATHLPLAHDTMPSPRTSTILAAVALLGAATLPAQQTATADPVLQRIWRLGMDSSQVQPLAQSLLDSIGPRLSGSPGMRAASDWVIGKYRAWGIDGKRDQYGTWRGWRRGASHIDLVSPRVRSLEGTMLAWSPGTRGRPVTAQAIVLPKFRDSAEFVRWLPQARGKIVLLSPAWPTCRPSEDWIRWSTPAAKARMDTLIGRMQADWAVLTDAGGQPDSARLYRGTGYSLGLGTGSLGMRLEKAGVAGMISSRTKLSGFANPFAVRGAVPGAPPVQGTGGWGVIEIFETYNTVAPAVTLSCEDYGLVFRLAENGQRPMVRLSLEAQLQGEQPAFNTIGTIRGSEKPDEYVMLSAHFDSWDGASGATDNGTGTLMAMEAMRILKAAYPRPKRTILVGHWASEEQGLVGSRAFTEDHPEVMKGLQALFNQDNGTGRVQALTAAGLTDLGRHLGAWHARLPSFFSDSASPSAVRWTFNDVPIGNPGGTDGAVFACYGTPSIGMNAVSWNYGSYTWHTNRDTYDKIVFDDLKHNATLAAMLAYLASEDPQFIDRTRSPGTWPANWPNNCGKAPRTTRPRL